MNIEHEIDQTLALRDHWMQVPHKCGLTGCPGDLNRRKLEMWEEMMAAFELVKSKNCGCFAKGEPDWHSKNCVIPIVESVLTKARKLENAR